MSRPVYVGPQLERTMRMISRGMAVAFGKSWWLSFGGLLGIVRYGFCPDSDFDLCTYYDGQPDYNRVIKAMGTVGYTVGRVMLNDTDHSKVLYMSFDHQQCLHMCLSFWYLHDNVYYYCHDSKRELNGVGVPSEYFFRGIPADLYKDPLMFRMVEWPGINQMYKIRCPRFAGTMLDEEYPMWAYEKQRFELRQNRQIDYSKMAPYNKSGAKSRFEVNVNSMAQWGDARHVKEQLENSHRAWLSNMKQDIN